MNASDYLLFASTFGLKSSAAGFLAEFDDEGTGKISSQDYILFANNFGTGFKNVTNITTIDIATGKITVPGLTNSQAVSSPAVSLAVPATSASAPNSPAATSTPAVVSANVSTDEDGSADAKGNSDRIDDIVAVKPPAKSKGTGKSLSGYHISLSQTRASGRVE